MGVAHPPSSLTCLSEYAHYPSCVSICDCVRGSSRSHVPIQRGQSGDTTCSVIDTHTHKHTQAHTYTHTHTHTHTLTHTHTHTHPHTHTHTRAHKHTQLSS